MAAENKIAPFMEGRHSKLVVFIDRVQRNFAFKNWTMKPIVVKHSDGVNGEKRPRLSKTLDGYELSGDMYMKDAEALETWAKVQAAEDANTAPLDQEGAVRFTPNDGTRKSFILDDLIWDDFELNASGRTEKNMIRVNMRFNDLKQAKTI